MHRLQAVPKINTIYGYCLRVVPNNDDENKPKYIMVKFKLKKGLDLRLKGKAEETIRGINAANGGAGAKNDGAQAAATVVAGDVYAVQPADFYGFKPKPVVKEGDTVKAGDTLFINKELDTLKVVSPVSGTVKNIVRGERRKLLRIEVEADGKQTYKDFPGLDIDSASKEQVVSLLLESGLFAFIRQRPFDIVANPGDTPKGIFVSLFSKMPLAQDFLFAVKGREHLLQTGIKALSKIATVSLGITPDMVKTPLGHLQNAATYVFDGPNPSGNVGVQINHISPVNKGEVVWTLGAEDVIFIGQLIEEGHVDLTRVIAVAGSEVSAPAYARVLIGTPVSAILKGNLKQTDHIRIINGNPLTGVPTDMDGHFSAKVTELTVIPEGDDKDEVLGWMMPRLNDYSTSRSYFSWLQGHKEYDLDARIKGGERHIIMSGEYDKYLPMNIYANYLVKAILVGDLDRMEALGIYEVAPEDFAVAEFEDSSKLELQRIVREGLDMLRKEL